MPRPPRTPNTQTDADKALWQRIRQDLAKATAAKRKRYGLRSNREAHLFCAPPKKERHVRRPVVFRVMHETSANPP